MISTKILLFFLVSSVIDHCFGQYRPECNSTTVTIQLYNGNERGISSQPSYCYNQGFTVIAQNVDRSKHIRFRFSVVPTNFDVQVHDGQMSDRPIQNCPIQSGSICYSSGNTVTFYFAPRYGGSSGSNTNRVELSAIPYNNSLMASFSFLTLIFCAFGFTLQMFF